MMHSPSHIVDRAQSRCSLPSPLAEFDELEVSTDSHCWPSQTDPCRSIHNFHVVEPPGGHHPPPMGKSQRFSSYRCQSFDVGCIYPSPPYTGFQAKLQDPLPEEADHIPSIFAVVDAGGILDSPPALRHIYRSHIPLSPPPTIPTTTHALPESESRQTSPRDDCDRPPLPSPESDSGDLPSHGELDLDSVNGSEVLLDESDPGGSLEPLLSPLSPEWSTKISNLACSSDESDSLSEPSSLTFGNERRELLSSGSHCSGSSPADESVAADDIPDMLDFPVAQMDKMDNSWHPNQCLESQNEWSSWINDCDLSDSSEPSTIHLDDAPPPSNNTVLVSHPPSPPWYSHFPVPHPGRLVPSALDIPHAHNTLIPTTHSDSKCFGYTYRPDDAFRVDTDRNEDTPGASSSSLSLQRSEVLCPNFSPPSFDDEFHSSLPTPFGDPYLPSSPSLRTHLPSLSTFSDDHDTLPASPSPSRRSFSTLPAFEDEDNIFRLPSSPNQSLLSLPGSETDDDLIPPFSSDDITPDPLPHTSLSPSHGLMLMDDQIEDYGQRSPSPELFDIDLDIDDDIYPEFEQLCELRKKALSAEREARSMETQLLEQGAFNHRTEARRLRKREKERAKEIGALLRLKLGNDKVAILQEEERKPKKMATSLPRLVAQMVFRRHDVNKPLATRHLFSDSVVHSYVPSSLSRFVSPDFQ